MIGLVSRRSSPGGKTGNEASEIAKSQNTLRKKIMRKRRDPSITAPCGTRKKWQQVGGLRYDPNMRDEKTNNTKKMLKQYCRTSSTKSIKSRLVE